MDTAAIFRVLGDALSIVGLGLIWSTSLTAWRRVPQGVKVPMQWGKDGKPTWRASKNFALWFVPVMATVIVFVPTVMGTTRHAVGLEQIVIVFAVRALMASGACIGNLFYLSAVFRTLQEEGVKLG